MKPLLARFRSSKPWRAWKRYGNVQGNILAAGVGYFAFFSIFPAVALAFAVFGFVLRGHPALLASVAQTLNANLPGFVRDAQHPQGLIPVEAPRALALTITGVIAFFSLVLAGMGWLGAVRGGVRAVFGVPGSVGNLVTTRLRELGVLFTLGLGIAASAVLTSAVGGAAGWLAARIGMSGQGWVLTLADLAVSVLADTALMLLLLRVLSGVSVPWRDLSGGALVGGLGFSLLKLAAATLLARVSANPLFASIAIVVGLLFWLNLIARLTLVAAAWAANDVDALRAGALGAESRPRGRGGAGTPEAAAASAGSLPTFGTRSRDRATLAAGVVLGATSMVATAALGAGLRSVLRRGQG